LPSKIKLVLGNQIYIEKQELPSSLINALIRLAAFQNPEFYKAQAMRLPTFEKPRIISCHEDFPKHISLPRGCLEEIIQLLTSLSINTEIEDNRFKGDLIDIEFSGSLRQRRSKSSSKSVVEV
jgi:hypothetical protein